MAYDAKGACKGVLERMGYMDNDGSGGSGPFLMLFLVLAGRAGRAFGILGRRYPGQSGDREWRRGN